MSDERHRQDVRERLRFLGYEVDDIPAGASEEEVADQWVHQGDDCFVVEIKSRIEDDELADQVASSPAGTVVSRQVPLARRNRLSGIVRKAASQVATSQRDYPGLGLLWFRPEPRLGITDAADQMEATLFGRRHAFCHRDKELLCLACYLVTHTDFHRFRTIDAVVIDYPDEGSKLLVNPYSDNQAGLRTTRLYRFFEPHGALIDLRQTPEPEGAIVVFDDFDRGDEAEALRTLEAKRPGWKWQFVEIQSLGGHIRLPDSPGG